MRCYLSHERGGPEASGSIPLASRYTARARRASDPTGVINWAKRWLRFSSTQLGGRWQLVASIGISQFSGEELSREGVM
jgi:hypothetical protein